MKTKNYILAFIILTSSICFGIPKKDKPTKFNKTESGLQYRIISNGTGENAEDGDIVFVHYIGKLLNDTVFDNSYDRKQPINFKLGIGQVIKGWEEGIKMLNKGAKAEFIIPANLAYGDKARPKIPANSDLKFIVELVDIKKGIKQWMSKTDTVTTETGLKYILYNKGEGILPENGDNVTVKYSGFLTNGKMFDSSVERDQSFDFRVGMGRVIKGWDEGLKLFPVGSKFKLIIPSELGYGERNNGMIPSNSTLIFDIELIDCKKKPKVIPFNIDGIEEIKTESGLKYFIIEKGENKPHLTNELVTVNYSIYIENDSIKNKEGKLIDSTIEREAPFEYKHNTGQVLKGWDEAISLLNIGSKARIILPYYLAYQEKGLPPIIPEKATIIIDLEILK